MVSTAEISSIGPADVFSNDLRCVSESDRFAAVNYTNIVNDLLTFPTGG